LETNDFFTGRGRREKEEEKEKEEKIMFYEEPGSHVGSLKLTIQWGLPAYCLSCLGIYQRHWNPIPGTLGNANTHKDDVFDN
jgi:hypothetical protein